MYKVQLLTRDTEMKVNSISSTNFGAGVIITYTANRNHPFLNNEIEALRKEFKFPVNFHTPKIELPSVSETLLKKLQELGIKFSNI